MVHESKKESIKYSSIFQDVKFVKLETRAECPISNVLKLSVDGDRIFVFDWSTHNVYAFNADGKFIAEVGKRGKGPGEVIDLNDFSINRKEKWVEVLDNGQRKILTYDYDGHFIREKPGVFAMGFESFNDESQVFYHYNFIFRDNQFINIDSDVVLTDSRGDITNRYSINPINRKLSLTTYTNLYKAKEEEIYLLPIFDYSIYLLAKDKAMKKVINLQFDNQPPAEIFTKSEDVRSLYEKLDGHNYPNSPQRLMVTDKYFYFIFQEGEKIHQTFIDRKTEKVKLLFEGKANNDLTFINSRSFVGAYDNGLVQSIDAIDFVTAYEKSGKSAVNYKGANAAKNDLVAKSVTVDDNPVLLFFVFK